MINTIDLVEATAEVRHLGEESRLETNLAVGQARSLLWAAGHLQDLLNVAVKVPNPDPLQTSGCFFSAILLRAFAAEVALKGLYAQETGKEADRIHDLSKLFRELRPATRNFLNQRFQRIRQRTPAYDGRPKTIEQVLVDHKDDFVDWRYVFEKQDDCHVELLDLEPAVEAIIEEYAENIRQQSGGECR